MLTYPQLSSGVIAQYPLERKILLRTIVNESEDGSQVRLSFPEAARVLWQLEYRGLSDDEKAALYSHYSACEGRLVTFTFLDPTDNLLRHSEDLANPVWSLEGLLTLSTGVADVWGTTRAARLTNTGGAPQSLSQTISAPGSFQYCFSAFLRNPVNGMVGFRIRTADGEASLPFAIGPAWEKVQFTGAVPGSATSVTFSLEIASGAVEVCGLQAEAQLSASSYKQTVSRSGVYPATRFDSDSVTFTSEGPSIHSVRVALTSVLES